MKNLVIIILTLGITILIARSIVAPSALAESVYTAYNALARTENAKLGGAGASPVAGKGSAVPLALTSLPDTGILELSPPPGGGVCRSAA